jgi:hypothetical protein
MQCNSSFWFNAQSQQHLEFLCISPKLFVFIFFQDQYLIRTVRPWFDESHWHLSSQRATYEWLNYFFSQARHIKWSTITMDGFGIARHKQEDAIEQQHHHTTRDCAEAHLPDDES